LVICRELLIQWWRLYCGNIVGELTEGTKQMYVDTKMRVKWRGNYILEGSDSNTGLRQSCSLSLALFKIASANVFRKWTSSTIIF
jgi:hypothetical protein